MSTRRQHRLFILACLAAGALSLAPAAANAATTYYWDTNGTTPGFGTASGTWAAPTLSLWSTSTNGTGTPGASITTTTSDSTNFGNGATGLGAGTITVSGTVSSGSMTFASGSGAITLSGGTITTAAAETITVNNATDEIDSAIGGAGTSLTKAGTGVLVLGGVNTYAGQTIVNSGTLAITGAPTGTGAITLNAGTLDLGGGTATGSLASTVLNLNGGMFSYTRTGNTTQSFTSTNINSMGSSISVVSGNTLNLGTVTRKLGLSFDLSSTGAGTVAADTANNVGGIMPGFTYGNTWAVANGSGSAITGLADGSYTLTSVAGTTGSSYNGNNIDVDNSAGMLDAAITANSVRFSAAGANTLTLQGTNVLNAGGIMVTPTVGGNLSTISGGTLAGASGKDLVVIQNNPSGALAINSVIANNGAATGLTKSGAGTLIFGQNNTYTGATMVNAGTIDLNGTTQTFTNLSGAGGTTVVNNGSGAVTLTVNNSADSTYAGAIADNNNSGTGTLALTKTGTSTITLTGTNSYSGGTTLSAGTVTVTSGSALGTGTITFAGNSSLLPSYNASVNFANNVVVNPGVTATLVQGNQFQNMTISGQLSGSGAISYTTGNGGGSGSLTLSNTNNTFTGTVTLYDAGNGNGLIKVNSFADSVNPIQLGASAATHESIFALNLGPAASLVFNNRHIELNALAGGTIQNNNADPSTTVTINTDLNITAAGNKIFTLGGSNTGANTFAGTISNSASPAAIISLTKSDAGTWILSGTNTYTGSTTLNGGTLSVGASTNLGAPASNLVFNGGTLQITGTSLNSFSGIGHTVSFTAAKLVGLDINNAANTFAVDQVLNQTTGGFTKAGAGVANLTQTNTYTGTTTLTGGTLQFQSGSSNIAQTLGGLVLAGPDVTLSSNKSGAGTLSTKFTTLTARVAGNTANIVSTGGTNGTDNSIVLGTTTAGFIDKGVYFNGADFAAGSAATNGYIRALAYGTDGNTAAVDTVTAGKHVKVTSSPASQATISLLSLNLSGSGINWTQNAGTTLTVPGIIKSGGGSGNISGGSSLTAGSNTELVIRTDTSSDYLTVGMPLTQGSGGLTKSGAGTLALSATSTYTGGTNINGGTLLVDGSLSATSGVTVASTATLGGSGTISSTVTVNGKLAPGDSPGMLTIKNLILASSATSNFEIGGTTLGTQYDNVNITGSTLAYGGALNVLNYGTYDVSQHTASYDLFTLNGAVPTGSFGSVVVDGVNLNLNGGLWTGVSGTTNYTFTPGTGVLGVTVPEPASLVLLAVGGLLMVPRRRKA